MKRCTVVLCGPATSADEARQLLSTIVFDLGIPPLAAIPPPQPPLG